MEPDGRYVANSEHFLEVAYAALETRFQDRESFDSFYNGLPDDTAKNDFLRVVSFYRYLVKDGDWHVHAADSEPVIGYLTNSYKLISPFSLIESLSNGRHVDFPAWLRKKRSSTTFPIHDWRELERRHSEYKAAHGSISKCRAFFHRLPDSRQDALCHAILINGKPRPSIQKVASFLYDLRCDFVHSGQLVLQVSDVVVLSCGTKTETRLCMTDLMDCFEEGVVAWFRRQREV